MINLMEELEDVRTYIDDLLVITNWSFDDHLVKLDMVLDTLQEATLRCNAPTCSFGLHNIEYLGYTINRDGIKPPPDKVLYQQY